MKSVKSQIEGRCRAAGIARPDNGKAPLGAIVWEGPSLWDGEPPIYIGPENVREVSRSAIARHFLGELASYL